MEKKFSIFPIRSQKLGFWVFLTVIFETNLLNSNGMNPISYFRFAVHSRQFPVMTTYVQLLLPLVFSILVQKSSICTKLDTCSKGLHLTKTRYPFKSLSLSKTRFPFERPPFFQNRYLFKRPPLVEGRGGAGYWSEVAIRNQSWHQKCTEDKLSSSTVFRV